MQANLLALRRVRGGVTRLVVSMLAAGVGVLGSGPAQAVEFSNVINVHSFSPLDSEGTSPRGDLLLGPDGNFYGTAHSGGALGAGAIFRLAPDGSFTTLHSFSGAPAEGSNPYAGLLLAADGNFYGTTYFGGANQVGSVFRISPDGAFTHLASFNSDRRGAYFPYTGLVQTPDGSFYGTTLRGGAADKGVIYRMDATGNITTVHEFTGGGDGGNPEGRLVIGPDGALYGTTLLGGASDRGSVYKITTSGTLTTLYSFGALGAFNNLGVATNADGANPRAGLTLGSDGNFYGTTYQGGAIGLGTVFRLTPAGAITTLHAFTGAPAGGANPLASVTRTDDGTLYGTTERGGSSGQGTAWQITPAGEFRLLHAFTGLAVDGGTPHATLVPLDGFLYGVSYVDSVLGSGAAFKLDLGTGGTLPLSLGTSPGTIATGASATLSWSAPGAATCSAGSLPTTAWTDEISTSGTKVLTPVDAGIYTYILNCTDGAGVSRNAYTALVVTAPAAQPVDGGATEGGGVLGPLALLLLGCFVGLTVSRRLPAVR